MRHPLSFNIQPHRWCHRHTHTMPIPIPHCTHNLLPSTQKTTPTRIIIFFESFVYFPCIPFAYVLVRFHSADCRFHFVSVSFLSFVAVTLSLDKHVDDNDSGILLMNWHDFIVCRLAIRNTNSNKVKHLCRCAAAAATRKEFSDRWHNSRLKKQILILCCAKPFSIVAFLFHCHEWFGAFDIRYHESKLSIHKWRQQSESTYSRIK